MRGIDGQLQTIAAIMRHVTEEFDTRNRLWRARRGCGCFCRLSGLDSSIVTGIALEKRKLRQLQCQIRQQKVSAGTF